MVVNMETQVQTMLRVYTPNMHCSDHPFLLKPYDEHYIQQHVEANVWSFDNLVPNNVLHFHTMLHVSSIERFQYILSLDMNLDNIYNVSTIVNNLLPFWIDSQ